MKTVQTCNLNTKLSSRQRVGCTVRCARIFLVFEAIARARARKHIHTSVGDTADRDNAAIAVFALRASMRVRAAAASDNRIENLSRTCAVRNNKTKNNDIDDGGNDNSYFTNIININNNYSDNDNNKTRRVPGIKCVHRGVVHMHDPFPTRARLRP